MIRRVVLLLALIVAVAGLGLRVNNASANPPPLPPVPPRPVLDLVMGQSGAPNFISTGVPHHVMRSLAGFNGVFSGVQNAIDPAQAISYFGLNGSLRELVAPLRNNGAHRLVADVTLPGNSSQRRPGKIIGVAYHPHRGDDQRVLVVTAAFPQNCPTCAPEKIRFYYGNGSSQYFEVSITLGVFPDADRDGRPLSVDEGVILAHKLSCITVGLAQPCWEPYEYSRLRQESQPKDVAYAAYTRFKDRYNLDVDFYVDDAVPDLLGQAQRQACANQVPGAPNSNNPRLSSCAPSVVMTAAKEFIPGQPNAIMVVLAPINTLAFTTTGQMLTTLPAGEYLSIDVTPSDFASGRGVLFLVNADRTNHYLIPTELGYGIARSSAFSERVAGIKDGWFWGHHVGRQP